MSNELLPILGKAESLSQSVPYVGSPNKKNPVWSYEEARERLLPQLERTLHLSAQIPPEKKVKSGVYFTVDLDFEFLAKSYFPKKYFDKAGWKVAGSLKIEQRRRDKTQITPPRQARRLFIQAKTQDLEKAYRELHSNSLSTQEERTGITRIYNIGLASNEGKIIASQSHDLDLFEIIVHPMPEHDWQDFQIKLFESIGHEQYPTILFDWVLGGETNTPRFMPIKISDNQLKEVTLFNPIRAIRPMPGVSHPRVTSGHRLEAASLENISTTRSGPTPSVGVFDGGADTSIPHLGRWVINEDITEAPEDTELLQHGTAVCGAILYGARPDQECPTPAFTIRSFRVLPAPKQHGIQELELYQLIRMIEETVKADKNKEIKTYVLSFGPDRPTEDDEIDPFTAILDRLAFEHDVLFIIAVGNNGECSPPFDRIQPPADAINGLGVGAYILDSQGNPTRAPYSCKGPGRCGNTVKPDIHMFGGYREQPFCVFEAGGNGSCIESMGTSFSAPLAASVAGNLLYRADDISTLTPQTTKALMIHKAFLEDWDPSLGWGPLSCPLNEMVGCTQSNVTLLYNGRLPLNKRTLLQIPFYNDIAQKGSVKISWTLVYATDVAPSMPDEYTLGGAQVRFRPNADVFTYTYNEKQKRIDRGKNPQQYEDLVRNKMLSRDKLPATESPNKITSSFLTEEQRRNMGIWDTAKHYWTKNKRFSSVKNPQIDIHAQARSDWYYDKNRPQHITYACVVSIQLSNPTLRLYDLIRTRVPELVEVRLRNRARTRLTT